MPNGPYISNRKTLSPTHLGLIKLSRTVLNHGLRSDRSRFQANSGGVEIETELSWTKEVSWYINAATLLALARLALGYFHC